MNDTSLIDARAPSTLGPGPAPLGTGSLLALALGTFAVGTEGFMIAAILPTVASSLSVTVEAAGQLVTVFALFYAITSPLLTALTAHLPRRGLLLFALTAFGAANVVAAMAPGYWALVGARILLALAAGLYVPNANAVAGALAAPEKRGRALAIINGGITTAIALGVPAGAVVGTHLGWRATFLGVALLSGVAVLILAVRLPRSIVMATPATLRERLSVIGHRGALAVLLSTTLWAAGAYTVYTYVSPLLSLSAGLSSAGAGLMLTLLGVSAMGGIAIGGAANDRFGGRAVQAVSLPAMAAAFCGLTVVALVFAPHALAMIVPLIVAWGLSAWSFFPSQQDRLIRTVGVKHAPVVLSLNASFMYAGFSLGAALGSLVIAVSSVAWTGVAGAACVVAAALLSRSGWKRRS